MLIAGEIYKFFLYNTGGRAKVGKRNIRGVSAPMDDGTGAMSSSFVKKTSG
jgi:hypothetical protein